MKPARPARPAHCVSIDDIRLDAYDAIIDARSPGEYAEDHLPGAVCLPVLDDEERARVGYLYKQVSTFESRRLGAMLASRNISRHLETTLSGHDRSWRPLIYCWRGGKRSGALTHVLREIGWNADVLDGGYRAYRRHVVTQMDALPRHLRFCVIQGPTGSGKSRLLAALARAGAQVLDLEDIAAHRGSVLGSLPERPQPSQKSFESRVLATIQQFDPALPVYVEGESRKIGQIQVPPALIETMRAAECVVIEVGTALRSALLLDEYRHFFDDPAGLETRLGHLATLHGNQVINEWKKLIHAGDWPALVDRLLREHYDPAYRKSAARNFARLADAPVLRIDSGSAAGFTRAAAALLGAPAARSRKAEAA